MSSFPNFAAETPLRAVLINELIRAKNSEMLFSSLSSWRFKCELLTSASHFSLKLEEELQLAPAAEEMQLSGASCSLQSLSSLPQIFSLSLTLRLSFFFDLRLSRSHLSLTNEHARPLQIAVSGLI